MNLSYEEFVSEFLEALKDSIPEAKFERAEVEKVNGIKDAIRVYMPEFKHVVPTVYLDNLYQSYQMGTPPAVIAKQLSQNMLADTKKTAESITFNKETAKEGLFPCAINRDMNKKVLSGVPHRDIEGTDLTLIARYQAGEIGEHTATCIITNANASMIGMNPEEALEQAIANGAKEKYMCLGISKVLADEVRKNEPPEEMIKEFQIPEKELCYMLSNEKMLQGAAVLAYPEEIKKAVESFGEEKCYILPSSIHEVLLVPESIATGGSMEKLTDMVKSVNENEVRVEEQLSNHVYFFDGNSLCIADTQTLSPKAHKSTSIGKSPSKHSKQHEKTQALAR